MSVICLDDQKMVSDGYESFVKFLQDGNKSQVISTKNDITTISCFKKNFLVKSILSCSKNYTGVNRFDYLENLRQNFGRRESSLGSYIKILFLDQPTSILTRDHQSKMSAGMVGETSCMVFEDEITMAEIQITKIELNETGRDKTDDEDDDRELTRESDYNRSKSMSATEHGIPEFL